MNNEYNDIQAFHHKYEIDCSPNAVILDIDVMVFRSNFMQEELDEFIAAVYANDLETAFDSLIDLVWVAKGTADMMGISENMWNDGWMEVVRANMTKVRATGEHDTRSKRQHKLDIVKPFNWTPPDLEKIIKKYENE